MLFALLASAALTAPNLTTVQKSAIKAAVEDKLKDPDSAQYKWRPWNGSETYCGSVNAKNSYGGYIGFTPFLALLDNRKGIAKPMVFIMLASADPQSVELKVIIDQCAKAGYTYGP